MSSTTTPPPQKVIDPPFYDPVLADGGNHSQAWTEYNQSLADQVNALAAKVGAGKGVTDGSDAASGQVGEYMTATAGGIALVNNTPINVVSLSLTAGDWQAQGNVQFTAGAGSHNIFAVGLDSLDTMMTATMQTTAINQAMNTATHRFNLTATTTVWLVAMASFSGTVTANGTISALRVR